MSPRDPLGPLFGNAKQSAAATLVDITKLATLFRAPDGDTIYATIEVTGHKETWPVRSKGFRRWWVGLFYAAEGKAPGGQAVADALGVVEAKGQFEGPVHPIHVRVAGHDDVIYLDLVNAAWEAIKVTAAGWSLITEPPVKFRRARGMLPLPMPRPGGSLTELRHFLNVDTKNQDQWALLMAWLIAAFRPQGPYPVLALLGEQGSSKTTLQEMFRALIDPNVAPLRAEPSDIRDIMIAASNGWVIALDNISDIEPWLSDCLCRLSTGGGFSTRELYSDGDEILFAAERPVMLNGINAVVGRADLLDRTVIVDLPRIPEKRRRPRQALWSAFEAARPAILGALLDAAVVALKRQPDVVLTAMPRMADFAIWATAAEPGLGLDPGAFLAAYAGNRGSIQELALEASIIAAPVRALADREASKGWKGTAAELLVELNKIADEATKRAKTWPAAPRLLSNALRRAAPNFRDVGVAIAFTDEPELGPKRRQIAIRRGGESIVLTVPTVLAGTSSVPPIVLAGTSSVQNDEELFGNDERNAVSTTRNARNDGNDEIPTRSGCPHHPVTPRPECGTCQGVA